MTLEPSDTIKITNIPKKTTVDCTSGVRRDTGEYTVTVSNKHGSDTATINVVVLGIKSQFQNLVSFFASNILYPEVFHLQYVGKYHVFLDVALIPTAPCLDFFLVL